MLLEIDFNKLARESPKNILSNKNLRNKERDKFVNRVTRVYNK